MSEDFSDCHCRKQEKILQGSNLHDCTDIPLEIISQQSPGGTLKEEKWLNDGAQTEATLHVQQCVTEKKSSEIGSLIQTDFLLQLQSSHFTVK